MAVDHWLLKNHPRPVFRLYGWEKPTLSIGYRQKFRPPKKLKKLAERFHTVIRPTGGGYLMHAGDITFSLVFPESHRLSKKSIMEFYTIVRDIFTKTAGQLNLIEGESRGKGNSFAENCLATPGRHEPVEQGRKWLATAQTRSGGGVLQHGSVFWNEKSWPKELQKTPWFLAKNSPVDRIEFRNKLLQNTSRDLFGSRAGQFYELQTAQWEKIAAQTAEFSTARLLTDS
jgi:lipoate-protein ligase A